MLDCPEQKEKQVHLDSEARSTLCNNFFHCMVPGGGPVTQCRFQCLSVGTLGAWVLEELEIVRKAVFFYLLRKHALNLS